MILRSLDADLHQRLLTLPPSDALTVADGRRLEASLREVVNLQMSMIERIETK